ncbi:hypothetical protein [Arcicella lustrica]|uniref:Uncharacterized protein n=1 Tax=Arcicella lustrica TaxID=2984196 RepID=A0ABU5SDJ3_9BACT|nr:hypothetical protein [Arcicella sp. DC25W]MEA5425353.1 hypothetical protein [Arcicella sp. DC25W]
MIKIFSELIKALAFGFLVFIFCTVINERLDMEEHGNKTKNSNEIPFNSKIGSLQYSLESRDTINRIIMQNSYSGKFHEIVLPKGTIVKSLKIN